MTRDVSVFWHTYTADDIPYENYVRNYIAQL